MLMYLHLVNHPRHAIRTAKDLAHMASPYYTLHLIQLSAGERALGLSLLQDRSTRHWGR
jgi:hypothetical protein